MTEYLKHFSNNTFEIINLEQYQVIRRNGDVMAFIPSKIAIALSKAFLAVLGNQANLAISIRDEIENLTKTVIKTLCRSRPEGGTFHIEDVQDNVELALMRASHHDVAKAYVLYREAQHLKRLAEKKIKREKKQPKIHVTMANGNKEILDINSLENLINSACKNLNKNINVNGKPILNETLKNLYDGVKISEVYKATILSSRTLIEKDPDYNYVTANLLLNNIIREVLGFEIIPNNLNKIYLEKFPEFINKGIKNELLNPKLLEFDLIKLAKNLKIERDNNFDYLGLQTLYDRYFLHVNKKRIELPQYFFMRVAMGLALNENNKTKKAIEFYELLSSFDFMSSTPTLFNSGTLRSQLSSCYLSTVPDDLDGIYEAIKDNALLSKFAGGLGNDWTSVRALGSLIKGTNGESQGVVPFLKVVNDTAVAVNQGGKRKGAVCTYLETWHLDIEEFLELRKNTGDDRRRTHDMNTANWIPDLFMKRVMENANWTLFSPNDVSDLHELYGKAFEVAYINYEKQAKNGEIKLFKILPAIDLWRKMLSMLFETGHPWLTFKDPCNIRSSQQHIGVVHSSNLCTEITLNTNENEIAVCNLGSINLAQHILNNKLDYQKLKKTVKTAMKMLDNVIDINFYAVNKAKESNIKHRPIGLGLMGFQDALYQLKIPYASNEAIEFADESMEAICYFAYYYSSELAKERGVYSTYKNSLWDKGILPFDSINLLKQERGEKYLNVDNKMRLDWDKLRNKIQQDGMRNSNCVAIAPTATISNIVGVDASIEPTFTNLSVKSNLSGEFTIINQYLVNDLKKLNLWDNVMVMDLKHFDGSLNNIERIPEDIKRLYKTAFEIDANWLIECASRRQKWIDQAQSLNIYISGGTGKKLDETYKNAWLKGLKTTYYLRTTAATNIEKSTIQSLVLNAVNLNELNNQKILNKPATDISVCLINNPDCESCQ